MPAEVTPTPSALPLCGIGDEAGESLGTQLSALTELRWNLIELRNVDGTALADLDEDAFDRLTGRLAGAGLQVACVDSRIANWARPIGSDFAEDLRELEILAERCVRLGTPYIRIMSYPNDGRPEASWRAEVHARMRELTARAESTGVVLVHENCAGWAASDPARVLGLLEHVDSPALKLLFDTGNGAAHGYEAYELLPEIAPYVAHVHIKDAVGDPSDVHYVLPGEGRCRVGDALRLLIEHGYPGVWSIEPHINVRPHESLTAAGADGVGTFVAYGRALEKLLNESVAAVTARSA
ncbi:sugar phosphate isomerase/epimerase [Streptomyces sp. UNOC14_S4]|uniref:sugar phosphate isomerase/epimerase family protein n=1 Tax=Streptomyces sp. UNOC14_S4 TaxID=2872340 RepID=UPI001E53CB12|nr:sugar phosphate isomerase/epimerase family protein [Streptomyces sp. UNOC14_S4]MCC3766764.1 sugar phosphate isomerase/epimerase [Streptomyces sp. UNOC14_S4]